jgi:hypothetical protein
MTYTREERTNIRRKVIAEFRTKRVLPRVVKGVFGDLEIDEDPAPSCVVMAVTAVLKTTATAFDGGESLARHAAHWVMGKADRNEAGSAIAILVGSRRDAVAMNDVVRLVGYTEPTTIDPTEDAFESIRNAMVTQPIDWSADHRNAWIYHIIIGWSSLQSIATKHRWSEDDVARLKRLRRDFMSRTKKVTR